VAHKSLADVVPKDAYRQARPDRYLGEHETYGTFPQWVEGEGVSDLFPAGTEGFGLRPTYINPVTEAIAEHPLTNIFTGGREMLRQGSSGPTISDWAMLGLSVIPGANVAARPVVSNIAGRYAKWLESASYDPTKVKNPYGLINRTKMNLAHIRRDRNSRRFDEKFYRDISESYARMAWDKPIIERQLAKEKAEHDAWMVAHKASVKAISDKLHRDIAGLKGSGSRLAEGEAKKGSQLTTEEAQKIIDEGGAVKDIIRPSHKSTKLPADVVQLPGTKPIYEMTWREWDDLHSAAFKLSDKQRGMMRAQGIQEDDVFLHFWGKGARDDYVAWTEEAVKKNVITKSELAEELQWIRQQDLRSGYGEGNISKIRNDIAWKDYFDEAESLMGLGDEGLGMVVAEKTSFKPSHVDQADWVKLTKDLSLDETINLARRMTLRLVD